VETHGRQVLQLSVPLGDDIPYTLEGTKTYLRQEAETNIAMRDEIVALVKRAALEGAEAGKEDVQAKGGVEPPRTGVQIVDTTQRKDTQYHAMKDLRNGNVVRNVTRSSARKLWRYAITQLESNPVQEQQVQWQGNLGLWKASKRAGKIRYDLVQRMPDGELHVYYGVTEDGIDGPWRAFLKE
jgi:hypothetical protein